MLTIQKEIPLPASPPVRYTGMAFDGASFYVTAGCGCKIYQYSKCFCPECSFETCRNYSSLCFDPEEQCFWASCDSCRGVIFKLNACFQEADCLTILIPSREIGPGLVTGISYQCGSRKLIVAFATCLVRVDPSRQEKPVLLLKTRGEWLTGVVPLCPYLLCFSIAEGRQRLHLLSADGKRLRDCDICRDSLIESAVLIPTPDQPANPRLMVLVSRRLCYASVWDCTLPCASWDPPVAAQCAPCSAVSCGRQPPGSETNRPDVLDSVAMMQRAIARMLDAERDKLQKLLKTSDDPSVILEASRSVRSAIVRATHLENVVYDVLSCLEENDGGACGPL